MIASMTRALTAHPVTQFRKSPRFYALYDGFYLVACTAVCVALRAAHVAPRFGAPSWSWLAIAPALLYAFIWAHLTIHNCTHGTLPRAINRLVGEVLGLIVVVRFASWDIIHMRHHKYSDHRTMDPHPNFAGFWKTVHNTVTQVEGQLFQQYFDLWGDTPENHRAERRRAWVSYGTNVALILAWTMVLGPWFTLLVFVPMNVLAGLFVIHFNWSTHNGARGVADEDFRPVNLDRGYYAFGNRVFAGIYMHANHHHRPHLFNPMRWDEAKFGAPDALVDAPAGAEASRKAA